MFSKNAKKFVLDITITRLKMLTKMDNPVSNEQFTDSVQYTLISGVSKKEMARKLRVSISTINRWNNGSSCPHPFGRKPAIMAMHEILLRK